MDFSDAVAEWMGERVGVGAIAINTGAWNQVFGASSDLADTLAGAASDPASITTAVSTWRDRLRGYPLDTDDVCSQQLDDSLVFIIGQAAALNGNIDFSLPGNPFLGVF